MEVTNRFSNNRENILKTGYQATKNIYKIIDAETCDFDINGYSVYEI
jgi:hypothetical protein